MKSPRTLEYLQMFLRSSSHKFPYLFYRSNTHFNIHFIANIICIHFSMLKNYRSEAGVVLRLLGIDWFSVDDSGGTVAAFICLVENPERRGECRNLTWLRIRPLWFKVLTGISNSISYYCWVEQLQFY